MNNISEEKKAMVNLLIEFLNIYRDEEGAFNKFWYEDDIVKRAMKIINRETGKTLEEVLR